MVAKIDGPFSWEDDDESYEKYTKTQTVKELQLVEEHMTKIHLQAAARLQREVSELEKKLEQAERLNRNPTKLIAIPEVLRQAGWMPIPKPLTKEAVGLLIGNSLEAQSWLMSVVRAIERAHGIGEKE
jgi:hypothetical protein